MGSKFSDTDKGYAELVRRVVGMKPVGIATGLLAKDGEQAAFGSKELSLLEVAIVNHFGSSDGHIPARPFVSGWFDAHEPELREMLTTLMQRAVKGELTRDQVLNQMGAYCVGSIQEFVAQGVPPPNAPSTIAKKGSSVPLINSGQLRSALSFEIREGGSK